MITTQMGKDSHKNEKKVFSSLISLVLILVVYSSFVLAAYPSLEGIKTVSPQVIYAGDNATITLAVTGVGDVYTTSKPVDVMLVIDNSCSMGGSKISDAKAAANLIIDELIASDRAGMVSFNTNPALRSQFTSDFASVRAKINALTVCGNTNIGEAINLTMTQFSGSNVRSLVLISDGNTNLPAHAAEYALLKAREAGLKNITIYTIGIGNNVDSNLLRSIATAGNGLYFHYPTGNALDNLFYGISQQTMSVAGIDTIVTDVLQLGVVPVSLPTQCSYSISERKVTCNAGQLNIGDTKTFSFDVIVYNSTLTHLNVNQYANYTNYLGNNASVIFNNPNVTILTRPSVCGDNIAPVVTINSPLNYIYNTSFVGFSINAIDTNLSRVWYNLNGTNVSYSAPSVVNLSNGNYHLVAYANDSCGNLGSSYIDFRVNLSGSVVVNGIGPNVTIISPVNKVYNVSLISLNIIAVDDVAIEGIWYNLNGYTYNYYGISTLNLTEGNYTLLAYANDSAGNIGADGVSFSVKFSNNTIPNNSTNRTATHTGCGVTHAPIDDFNVLGDGNSISINDEEVIVLNYLNNTTNEGFNLNASAERDARLIFNMILLIAIILLLLALVLVARRK